MTDRSVDYHFRASNLAVPALHRSADLKDSHMTAATTDDPVAYRREQKKILAGTLVGTSIEWYDFFIYAQAAGLVLSPLFLKPLNEDNPGLAQIISFATVGISFLFRPVGAIVAGQLGDRIGRKKVLVLTLILMGVATALIGLLPTYASIGIAAPILLITLRIVQGFAAGGEWGGAALMAVEHAPNHRRAFFGSFPQIGVPIGLILATSVLFILQKTLGKEAFLEWGWRIPFLSSVLLIIVGWIIRRTVEESPVFHHMQENRKGSVAPLRQLFRSNSKEVLVAALSFISVNCAGYLLIAFFISYMSKTLKVGLDGVLLTTTLAAAGWLVFALVGGLVADRIGRVRTFQIGYTIILLWCIPMWFLMDTRSLGWYFVAAFVLSIGLGLAYGPQAALHSELFPAAVRYSGVSIAYAIGAVLGGAFAPTISEWILRTTGESWHIGVYVGIVTIISLIAVSSIKDRMGVDLNT